MVRAVKRMTIERAPNVLVLQLKRFEYSMYGSKIAKKVRVRRAGVTQNSWFRCRNVSRQQFSCHRIALHSGLLRAVCVNPKP